MICNNINKKILIIYDVDDVLNNLNQYCLDKLGLPWGTRFNTYENECYTKEQADDLMEAYGDPETFRNLELVAGAEDIFSMLNEDKAEVKIVSRNFNQDVADVKMEWLLENIPNASKDKIEMQIGLGANKKVHTEADIIIEDCITNCLKYEFRTIKLLIDKPNNQSEVYGIDEKAENIIRVKSLIEANALVKMMVG